LALLYYICGVNETLTVRLGEDLAEALGEEARQTGLSKGQIAREALEERLRRRSKSAVMTRHFGSMRGPKDLSSNKNYRRDWKRKAA
jgi:hypothetical protein